MFLADLDGGATLAVVQALEPGEQHPLSDDEFDRAYEAAANFADIKSPYTLGHSTGVAWLAIDADGTWRHTTYGGLTETDPTSGVGPSFDGVVAVVLHEQRCL